MRVRLCVCVRTCACDEGKHMFTTKARPASASQQCEVGGACVCARARARVCVCVCVRMFVRERVRVSCVMCVCVCVCV